jgi:hypothetical protein
LKLLKRLCEGYVAVADLPPAAFIEELQELYPAAKVLLVHRNPQQWWASIMPIVQNQTLLNSILLAPLPGIRWASTIWSNYMEWTTQVLGRDTPFGPEFMDEHAEYIRRVVPKERLLEMELSQGWEPLCRFLGRPVPEEVPFPQLNESKMLSAFQRKMRQRGVLAWLGILTTVSLILYSSRRLWLV